MTMIQNPKSKIQNRPSSIIVGAGPNGLAAAITLARAGRSVLVLEGRDTVGGRAAVLTLRGFVNVAFSAFPPRGVGPPFFRGLPLRNHGMEWVEPPAALAPPLDAGPAGMLEGSLDATADNLGRDGPAYRRLIG